MVDNLKEDYSKAKERVALKERIKISLEDEKERLERLYKEFELLKERVKKEGKDVERLEKLSFSNLLATLKGNKESKLEKEELELFNAKSDLEAFRIKVITCEEQVKHYERKLEELRGAEENYKRTREKLKEALMESNDLEISSRLKSLEEEAKNIEGQVKEMDEVLSAGETVLNYIGYAEKALSSAEDWGFYDVIGGGFVSSIIKQERIREAKQYIEDIEEAFVDFNKELKDVNMDLSGVLQISEFEANFDIWLDNIFTDYSVLSKIEDAIKEIRALKENVFDIVNDVKSEKKKSLFRLEVIEKEVDDKLNFSTMEG